MSKPPRRTSRLSEGARTRPLDYELNYPGKRPEVDILTGSAAEVQRILSLGFNGAHAGWRNRIYYGDNSGILRNLMKDESVRGEVALVYIDPPFASGARFESRDAEGAYEDVLWGGQYIEFLRERLILLRELLSSQGSIYVHLDSKMAFPMKVVMDEVFGPVNFRNWITRKKCNSKNYTRKQYGNTADYILFYTKTEEYTWNKPVEPWTAERAKEYQYTDESGRLYMKVPVHAPGVRNGETGKPWRGILPPPGKHWQYSPQVLDELDAKGEIYWSPTGNPRRKVYFDQSEGVPVQDIWMDFKDAHNQNIDITGYPTEKSVGLIRRIVKASSNPGDLVLDCFMGSGTTLEVAEEEDRRWLGIDIGRKAVETTIRRLARGREPMGDYVNGTNGKSVRSEPLFSPLRTNFDLFQAPDCESCFSSAELRNLEGMFPLNAASSSQSVVQEAF